MKKRNLGKKIFIVLIVLSCLAVTAELGFRWVIKKHIATQAQEQLRLSKPPKVEIGGISVLYSYFTGSIPEIVLKTDHAVLNHDNKTFVINKLKLYVDSLSLDKNLMVYNARVYGTIPWDEISKLTNAEVHFVAPNKIGVIKTSTIANESINGEFTFVPKLSTDKKRILVERSTAKITGVALPDDLKQDLFSSFQKIEIPLVFGLKIKKVSAKKDGLEVEFSAKRLSLNALKR